MIFSQAFSGCGIIPNIFPSEFIIPAILFIDPLGLYFFDTSPNLDEYLKTILSSSSNCFIILLSA